MQTIQQNIITYGYTGQIIWNLGPEVLGGAHYDINANYPLAWAQLINRAPPAFTFPGLIRATAVVTANSSSVSPAGSTGGSSDPNFPTGWTYSIQAGPNRVGSPTFISGTGEAINALAFISNAAIHDDVHIFITKQSILDLLLYLIPFPWVNGFNTASEIYQYKALASFNGYPVQQFDSPVTVVLPYDPQKLHGFNPANLRIAFFNSKTKKWEIEMATTVVNTSRHTVGTTVSGFSYFVIVYPQNVQQVSISKSGESKQSLQKEKTSSAP